MTSAFQPAAAPANGAARSVVTIVVGLAVAAFLALVGVTLFALSVASPIALSLAESVNAYVSASDKVIAAQLAVLAPAFAVGAVASLVGALATIVVMIKSLSAE